MVKIYANINEQLKVHGFKKIEKFEEFEKYFDLDNLDEDGTPKIVTEKKAIVIFDNSKYNETYLIDLVNNYIDKNLEVQKLDLLYIDSPEVRRLLFCPKIVETDFITVEALERDFLIPTVMVINPIENQLTFFQESIIPFDESSIENIFVWLKI